MSQRPSIPTFECKEGCSDCCKSILVGKREWKAIVKRIGSSPHIGPDTQVCPLLKGGRCSVYDIRPTVCLLPNAWVYTECGPMQISSILAGHRVYGSDGLLHPVLATQSRLYSGPVINVRCSGTHIPCWSTPDHRWLCTEQRDKRKRPDPEWLEASRIVPKFNHKLGTYLILPRNFEDPQPLAAIKTSDYVNGEPVSDRLLPFTSGKMLEGRLVQSIPREIAVGDEFLFMLGLYLAEGSASWQAAHFTMNVNEQAVLERVQRYLATLGIASYFASRRKTLVLTVPSCLFARMMKRLGGQYAAEKRVDEVLFAALSHRQKWSLYEAWETGDGRQSARSLGATSVTTASERLAMQMGFIAVVNGYIQRTYRATFRKRLGAQYFTCNLFASNWDKKKLKHKGLRTMQDERYIYMPALGERLKRWVNSSQLETKHYDGPVVDLEVEGESFVTSSGIVHNCRLFGTVEDMQCPHGCGPEKLLTHAQGEAIFWPTVKHGYIGG